MKNIYEGLFILPKTLSEEAQEAAVGRVRDEITKVGGEIKSGGSRSDQGGFSKSLRIFGCLRAASTAVEID